MTYLYELCILHTGSAYLVILHVFRHVSQRSHYRYPDAFWIHVRYIKTSRGLIDCSNTHADTVQLAEENNYKHRRPLQTCLCGYFHVRCVWPAMRCGYVIHLCIACLCSRCARQNMPRGQACHGRVVHSGRRGATSALQYGIMVCSTSSV